MKFFQTVKDSVYNPGFYMVLPMRPVAESVKYFARLVFLISCILAIFPIIAGIALLSRQDKVGSVRTQIVEAFPQDLVVNVKNGEVSTNATEPYSIPQPPVLREEMMRWMKGKTTYDVNNLLVINTRKPIELTDFQTYRTLAVLGRNEVGFYSPDRGSIEIQSLRNLSVERPIDRESFGSFVDSGWSAIKSILVVLMILSPFLIFIAIFVAYLIYLILGALVVWLASAIRHTRMTYGQSYQAGLHLITLPLILSFLIPFILHLPFVFTLALFVMALINFEEPERSETETVPR